MRMEKEEARRRVMVNWGVKEEEKERTKEEQKAKGPKRRFYRKRDATS